MQVKAWPELLLEDELLLELLELLDDELLLEELLLELLLELDDDVESGLQAAKRAAITTKEHCLNTPFASKVCDGLIMFTYV